MRKLIKVHILYSMLVWLLTMILFSISHIKDIPHWVNIISLFIGTLGLLFSFTVSISFTHAGLDKNWFKTQEELQTTLTETKKEWDRVHTITDVIGRHEAVKLWEEAKKEKHDGKRREEENTTGSVSSVEG